MHDIEYRLPPAFYHDHRARDLPETGTSELVRETSRYVIVRMDAAALVDLRSDAEHYVYSMGPGGFKARGLVASARATVKALGWALADEAINLGLEVDPERADYALLQEDVAALRGLPAPVRDRAVAMLNDGRPVDWNALNEAQAGERS